MSRKLAEYRRKRNFRETAEPPGAGKSRHSNKQLLFVIQKHAASHLHYDFRLEMGGVLKSWAVPKGLPLKKGERRLAMQVEDHPFEYANFEGTIPAGNYGAGTVMVWDSGTYDDLGGDPLEGHAQGKLHLHLKGKKLDGEWTLVRMKHPRTAGKEEWLLLKTGADASPLSARLGERSVLTKRTLEQIASDNDAQWQSNHTATTNPGPPNSANVEKAISADPDLKGLPVGKASFIEPMKALLVDQLPTGNAWIYEVKFDGYRVLAVKHGDKIKLISRNNKDLTERYRPIARAMEQLPVRVALFDGEVVATDSEGRSSFQLLQSYQTPGAEKPPLFYYVFDLLNLEGKNLMSLPLLKRKTLLRETLAFAPEAIRFSASVDAEASRLIKEMKKRGLEGLVAKRVQSQYEPGRRSGAWIKFKWTLEQEFIIGGFTPPKGARESFGAILVGYYEDNNLLFASKVGTGFDVKGLDLLHKEFQKRLTSSCPFTNLPESVPGGLTGAEMRRCTWLKPKLICQVRFTEWTRDHHLRHPVFLGLREDKKPTEVIRERPSKS